MKKNEFNKSSFGSYNPVVDISPYSKVNDKRLANPKFIFRYILKVALKNREKDNITSWRDIGCANGEFLYYLCNSFTNCKFYGVDITKEFIEIAKKILKKFDNVILINDDILNQKNEHSQTDVVSCANTIQIFPEPAIFLNTLMDLVKPNGLLIIEGCFNPFDISMIIKYLDESNTKTENLWRCDFNLHSEKMIKRIISERQDVKSFNFHYPVMDQEIPKIPNAPDINMWTESRKEGGYDIVNGMNRKFNPGFLIVEKK